MKSFDIVDAKTDAAAARAEEAGTDGRPSAAQQGTDL
jgi:hypothetical protein